MKEEYIVREDIGKILAAILVYTLFVAGLVVIILVKSLPILGVMLLALLAGLLSLVIFSNVRKLLHPADMYKICKEGIYDYTKEHEPLFLTWEEIMKVEMLANNSSLQIGILASKTLEEREEMNKRMKENLRENGNRVFYSIMLDGFQFHKKHFQEIYQEIKRFAIIGNPNIVCIDYEDPILKRKKNKSSKGIL
ncbi:hypothetical protein ACWG0P_01885 [Amedibacillus sp. YH-ame6]